jgi:hypothetical protein
MVLLNYNIETCLKNCFIFLNIMNTVELLKSWKIICKKKSIMHDLSYSYIKKYNILTMIPSIILSGFAGITMVSIGIQNSTTDCDKESNLIKTILPIFFGICGVVSSSLIGINRFLQYPEIQQRHDIYSDEFEILHNDIYLQLSLDESNSMYKTSAEFAKFCKARLDILIDKAPQIPPKVIEKYKKMMSSEKENYSIRINKSFSNRDQDQSIV